MNPRDGACDDNIIFAGRSPPRHRTLPSTLRASRTTRGAGVACQVCAHMNSGWLVESPRALFVNVQQNHSMIQTRYDVRSSYTERVQATRGCTRAAPCVHRAPQGCHAPRRASTGGTVPTRPAGGTRTMERHSGVFVLAPRTLARGAPERRIAIIIDAAYLTQNVLARVAWCRWSSETTLRLPRPKHCVSSALAT